jgi:hypothetical protein
MNLEEGELARGSTEFVVIRAKESTSLYFVYCLARYSDFRNTAILSMRGTSGDNVFNPQCSKITKSNMPKTQWKTFTILVSLRVARILSTLMAFQAELPMLNFKDITGGKIKHYFAAINSGMNRDYGLMEKLFEQIIATTQKTKSGEI